MGERKRERHRRLDRGARGRSTTRHARRDDQREREGPYRSTMKAQDWNLLIHAVQSSTPARLACRQWTISSRHRLPLPMTSALPIALQAPPSAAPATRLPLALQSTTHLYVASARMREIWRTGCVARTAETPSTTLAAAVSAAFVAWPKSIDVPLSGPKRQNSSKKGRACSTRGAGGRQALPTPWPVGTAIAHAPDRSHRRPGAVLHCRTVDFLKKARC